MLIPCRKYGRPEFRVDRSRDNLPELVYTSIKEMHEDYKNDVLTPQLLKPAVTKALIDLVRYSAPHSMSRLTPKSNLPLRWHLYKQNSRPRRHGRRLRPKPTRQRKRRRRRRRLRTRAHGTPEAKSLRRSQKAPQQKLAMHPQPRRNCLSDHLRRGITFCMS